MRRIDWWNDQFTEFSIYRLASYWKFHENFVASQWQSWRVESRKPSSMNWRSIFDARKLKYAYLSILWWLVPTRHYENENPWFIAIKQNGSPMTKNKSFRSNSVRSQHHMDKRVKEALMGQLTMMARGRSLPLRDPRCSLKSHHHLKKFEKATQSKKKEKNAFLKEKPGFFSTSSCQTSSYPWKSSNYWWITSPLPDHTSEISDQETH